MPSVYVFPGGSVDTQDRDAPATSELRPDVERRLRGQADAGRIRALAVAALRETFEETGLAFGRRLDTGLAPALDSLDYLGRAITPASSPIRFHARFFVARAGRARGQLEGNGELLDLRWHPIPEALELPIIDVTRFMLHELQDRLDPAQAPARPERSLFVRYRREQARLVYEP